MGLAALADSGHGLGLGDLATHRIARPLALGADEAGAEVALEHGLGGRVRWWICGWRSSGTSAPVLRESTSNVPNDTTLYLQSYVAGTACIRVEQAG